MKKINYYNLYDMLLPNIKESYFTYSFFSFSKEEFSNIIADTLKHMLSILNCKNINRVDIMFNKIIKIKIANYIEESNKDIIQILNNFMDNYINFPEDYNTAITEINKLIDLLDWLNLVPNLDLYLNCILNHPTIREILKIIDVKVKTDSNYHIANRTLSFLIKNYNLEMNKKINYSKFNESYFCNKHTKYYLDSIPFSRLTLSEEKELGNRILLGDSEAKKKLVMHNLKLVVTAVKKYSFYGLSFEDLIQEGNIALIKAANDFDVRKNCRFSSVAYRYITNAVKRAIANKSRNIRIPHYLYYKVLKFIKFKNEFIKNEGCLPTLEEVAVGLNLPLDTVIELNNLALDTISLNSSDNVLKDESLDNYQNVEDLAIEDIYSYNAFLKDILEVYNLCSLNERQRQVLDLRYGLTSGYPLTCEEIGKMFNVTRARISNIENRALRRIKKSKKAMRILSKYNQ